MKHGIYLDRTKANIHVHANLGLNEKYGGNLEDYGTFDLSQIEEARHAAQTASEKHGLPIFERNV
ncbi:hypothetical protein ACYFX5_08855 [Bremerella sp. T1]|uniref:hypothetical protein n=1 Tax=Bremerella sp. TYQ1 TaxID=3119568 RepID=UPI001CCBD882|nr:hypothetical protein [Bremerella volcania]UBM38362.1 hypothetical protein LA756_10780 [Bremerella volcania]